LPEIRGSRPGIAPSRLLQEDQMSKTHQSHLMRIVVIVTIKVKIILKKR
jgi:hypothetical protein